MLSNNNQEIRQKAFDKFKSTALNAQRDYTYNLAFMRIVPQFSTASAQETAETIKTIQDMTRLGHGQAAVIMGERLYYWAQDNGYSRSMP